MRTNIENTNFLNESFNAHTLSATKFFRKNFRRALKEKKHTIASFAGIVGMSVAKIQRFQATSQQGSISLDDAVKISSALNISLEDMCGVTHSRFGIDQTRKMRDYFAKHATSRDLYFQSTAADQIQERKILSYLDEILNNSTSRPRHGNPR